jgi:cysteine-rich repeat protein
VGGGGDDGVDNFCGDGRVEGDELCDDENTNDGDGCSADCQPEVPPNCGDGIFIAAEGEFCDDGNLEAGDGCGPSCRIEGCGNQFLDANEACEDGNTDGGDGCSADCKSDESCGNGIIDVVVDETCDDGNEDDTDTCPTSCQPAVCGDGFVQRGVESCDGGGGCTACVLDSCGNGAEDSGEECDLGPQNGNDGSTCMATCLTSEVALDNTFTGLPDPIGSIVSPQWVDVDDFNDDGRADIAFASTTSVRSAVAYGIGDGRLAPQRHVTPTSGSDGAVFADLDGDGRLDFALVSDTNDSVAVVLDDGAGNYVSAGTFTTLLELGGDAPFDVAAAELTGDQHIDLVTSNVITNDVTLMQGAGDGTFTAIATFGVQSGNGGQRPESVAIGDVTGDGILDIVTANRTSSDVAVLAGLGGGSFAPVEIYSTVAGATGTGPFDLILADVTNDARLDVLTANGTSSDVAVLVQASDGTLQSPLAFPTFVDETGAGIGPRSLAVGDVNKDGIPDIVTANISGNDVSVLFGLGAGAAFGAPTLFDLRVDETETVSPVEIQIADIDRDNNRDLVVGGSDGTVRPLLGDGAGGFAMTGSYAVTRSTSVIAVVDLAVADIDGDGHRDVMVSTQGDALILSGTGDGRVMPPAMVIGGGGNAAVGDMNGDGRPDLLAPQSASTVTTRSLQLPAGSFQATNFTTASGVSFVGLGDFDGVNAADALAFASTSMLVYQNDGLGNFLPANPASVALPTLIGGVAVGDISGDGDLDVVVSLPSLDQVGVMVGDGSLGFTNPALLDTAVAAGGDNPGDVALADIDGAMGLDIITANQSSNDVTIFRSNGLGTFAAAKNVPAVFGGTPAQVTAVAAGDLNGDGHIDLVTANLGRDTISVIMGFGNGSFAAPQVFDCTVAPSHVAVADFNRDGLDDIAVTGQSASELQIFLSRGHP